MDVHYTGLPEPPNTAAQRRLCPPAPLPSPLAGTPGSSLIRIRLPDGSSHQRRFLADDTLQASPLCGCAAVQAVQLAARWWPGAPETCSFVCHCMETARGPAGAQPLLLPTSARGRSRRLVTKCMLCHWFVCPAVYDFVDSLAAVTRAFNSSHHPPFCYSLQAVYDFVDSLAAVTALKYSLASTFPRRVYGAGERAGPSGAGAGGGGPWREAALPGACHAALLAAGGCALHLRPMHPQRECSVTLMGGTSPLLCVQRAWARAWRSWGWRRRRCCSCSRRTTDAGAHAAGLLSGRGVRLALAKRSRPLPVPSSCKHSLLSRLGRHLVTCDKRRCGMGAHAGRFR